MPIYICFLHFGITVIGKCQRACVFIVVLFPMSVAVFIKGNFTFPETRYMLCVLSILFSVEVSCSENPILLQVVTLNVAGNCHP